MNRKNKGFSLVELVVAVAILSIVCLGVVSFLATSTQSYASVSQNVNVQEEAQTAINQIVTMIQNAEMGITDTDRSDDGSLLIYNEDYRYVIALSGGNLYYLKQDVKEDDSSTSYSFDSVDLSDPETGGFSLLAENVETFSVKDVTESGASRTSILLSVDFKGSGSTSASYTVAQNVVLRNSVLLNPTNYEDVYGTPDSPIQKTTYSNLTVTIDNPIGSDTQFSYTPESTGAVYVPVRGGSTDTTVLNYSVNVSYTGPNPDPSYTVTLTGAAEGTAVDAENKQVYISASQEQALTLNFALVKNTAVQVNIPIIVVRVNNVNIRTGSSVSNGFDKLCYAGNTVQLDSEYGLMAEAVVSAAGRSDWNNVSWSVSIYNSDGNPEEGYPQTISGGSFTIPEQYVNEKIRFTATSTFDSTVSDSVEYDILAAHSKINLALVTQTMDRGSSSTFNLTNELGNAYDTTNGYNSDNLEYTVIVKDAKSGEALSDNSGVTITKRNCTITISSSNAKLDYNKTFTVSMMVKDKSLNVESSWVEFTIPAVTVEFSPNVVKLFDSENRYPNYYKKKVEYAITGGIVSSAISGNPDFVYSERTDENYLYEDTNGISYDSSNMKGTFCFYRQYTGNNLNRTVNISLNGTTIQSEPLYIYGSNIPDHTLTLTVKDTASRGEALTVKVTQIDRTTGESTDVTQSSNLTWKYYIDDSRNAVNNAQIRSGNIITLWSSNGLLSYNSSHTVKLEVSDDTETASAVITIPKVTIEYETDSVCMTDYATGQFNPKYSATVSYTINGLVNARIFSFQMSGGNGVSFSYADGSFTVTCNSDSIGTLSGNARVGVSSENSSSAIEISSSTFTVYGKKQNVITINGYDLTIDPNDTQLGMTGDYQYQVYDDRGGKKCWVYSKSEAKYYFYSYSYDSKSWTLYYTQWADPYRPN